MAQYAGAASQTGINFCHTLHSEPYAAIDPSTASDLTGRSVFLTGAATQGGVGRATALAFATAGAAIIALGDIAPWKGLDAELIQAAKTAGRAPPKILLLDLDVTSSESVNDAAQRYKSEIPDGLDILINNAGFLAPYVPLLDADPDTVWRSWEVNVKGLFNMTRAFLPLLLAKQDGLKTIVNVASAGALAAVPGGGSYRASKLAVLRLTEVLQIDYKEQGLLAYCIHPGAVRTTLASDLPDAMLETLKDKPELAAATLAWLTQERREWLAGRYVSCAWDMPELMSKRDDIVAGDKLKMKMAF